jgi:polysaccharide pyruvyl transferase WcaK-like protein
MSERCADIGMRQQLPHCHLLFNGLAAGNIGDEAMFAGFCRRFAMEAGSTVEVFDGGSSILDSLPSEYTYIDWRDESACDDATGQAELVLLVGDTPVSELHGTAWPLEPLGRRLQRVRAINKRVDAVAVGVDALQGPEAIGIFRRDFDVVRSWTTRSAACRAALLALGTDASCIQVAADLAWLCPSELEPDERAGSLPSTPKLAVNIVGEDWADDAQRTRSLATALDEIAVSTQHQVLLIANETRGGTYFDHATAERIAALMRSSPIVLEPRYVTPRQQLAILSACDAVVSQRYHMGLMGVLAGCPVALFERGDKLRQLIRELDAPDCGPHDNPETETIVTAVSVLLSQRAEIASHQASRARTLRERGWRSAGAFISEGKATGDAHS